MAKPKQLELFVPTAPKQLWLMNFKNPLRYRFGKDFFSSIPQSPGVYKMMDERGEIIYVGKAKNLRNRLRSYTHAHVENSSRKVLRLIELARTIEWEEVEDEKAALLRENHLLRTLAPYFNVVNTSPHTYLFAHLKLDGRGITLHLAMTPDKSYEEIYGAFKGLGLTYRAHKAILRLLWMCYRECRNGFELPSLLTNRRKLAHHAFEFPKGFKEEEKTRLFGNMKRFFNGTSKSLLDNLIENLLAREDLAGFTAELIQGDIETAHEFYERCARRNRKIKKVLKLKDRLLAQDQIDDYIVIARNLDN